MLAIEDVDPGTVRGYNWHTDHALAAYVLAVASVEAFINEVFVGPPVLARQGQTVAGPLDIEGDLEGLDLRTKLVLLPQLAFGKTLSRDRQPYQDMAMLIKARNDLVHYKMRDRAPKYVAQLLQRGIALVPERDLCDPAGHLFGAAWTRVISTVEGIRWAHNTACATVMALGELMAPEARLARWLVGNFKAVPDTWIREYAQRRGIVPRE